MTTAPESRVTALSESLPLAEAQLLSTPPAEARLLTRAAEEQLSIPPAEIPPTTLPAETPLGREAFHIARYYLGNRWVLLALGAGVLVAGAALNWSWLVAVGLAPILLAVAPCAIMCALGLCAMKMSGGSK
jgi:hypothetical protein